MKRFPLSRRAVRWLVLALTASPVAAQPVELPKSRTEVAVREANLNVVSQVRPMPLPEGTLGFLTNTFYEIASGLNYQDSAGVWRPAEPVLELEEGQAVGRRTQHRVWFPGVSGSESTIRIRLPSGEMLETRVYGLAYYDPESGQSVLLAEAREAPGFLEPPGRVRYPAAFDSLDAELVYHYTRQGLEQDVVLHEMPPPPDHYHLGPQTRLEVWTEFYTPTEPQVKRERTPAPTDAADSAPSGVDDDLNSTRQP